MYKVLSICLAFSLAMSEITTVKQNTVVDVTKNQANIKKPKSGEPIELNTLITKNSSVEKEDRVLKRVKKIKQKHDRSKDEVLKLQSISKENTDQQSNLGQLVQDQIENSSPSLDAQILREKQAKEYENQSPHNMPAYIQGPKPYRKSSQSISLSREHEGLFFSEYAEGSQGNNKYMEIYNASGQDVDLSEYYVMQNANGGPWDEYVDQLEGTLAAGDVYVIANSGSNDAILAEADLTGSGICFFNGDDARALVKIVGTDTTVIDYVGDFPDDPGSGWSVAGVANATEDHTLVRKPSVMSGNAGDWAGSAGTTTEDSEWILSDAPTNDYVSPTIGSHEIEAEQEEDAVYLTEGFEGDFPPAGWSTSGDSISTFYYTGDAVWQQGPADGVSGSPSSAFSGSYFAYFYDFGFSTSAVGDLITPSIDLSSAIAPILYFQYSDGGGTDNVDVQVSNADGSFSSVFLTPTATSGWEEIQVDLSSYVGQSVSIRFVGSSVYGSSNPSIDDVKVSEPPSYPIADLSTGVLNFGPVFVDDSKSLGFAISNTGGADLSGSIVSDNSKFTIVTQPARISPGETVVVTATYAPETEGTDVGYFVYTHNGDSSPDSIMVTGSGTLDILNEGFEGPWSGDPSAPGGWSQITVAGSAPWDQYTSSFYAHSGLNSARAPASSGNSASPSDHLLISPALDLTAGYYLKFFMDGSSGSSSYYTNIEVQISSQNTDATTGWTDLARYIQYDATGEGGEPQPFSYEEISINLSGFTGINYIAFRVIDLWGYSVYIDDVRVEPIPARPVLTFSTPTVQFPPTFLNSTSTGSFSVDNVGAASATVDIVSDNSKFVVSPANVVIEQGTPVEISIAYTPTEEGADSGYIVLTHEGDSSPDSVMVQGAGSLNILTEGFDGPWTGDPAAPLGWTVVNSDGDSYTWSQSSSYIPEVTGFAAHGMGSQDDWLISPLLTLDGGYSLKWWDVVESSSYNNTYDVYVFPGGDTTAGVNLGTYDCLNTVLTQHVINLSAYNGQSVSVGFHQTYSAATFYGFGIDDVTVEPLPQNPVISVSPSSLEFMATAIGSSEPGSVAISNLGEGDLSGTIVYSDGFSGPASFGTSDNTITISFSPTSSGMFSGTATITSNGGDDVIISLNGNSGVSTATWDLDVDGDGEGDWPVGWETVNVDGNGDGWEFYGGGSHTGDGYTSAGSDGSGTINEDFLISPKYSVSTGDVFSFFAGDDGGSSFYPDIMTVHVSPTGGMNPTDFTVQLDSVVNMGTGWYPYSYDLTDYIGTEVRMAIVYRGVWGYALNVDDIAGPEIIQEAGPVIYDYPSSLVFAGEEVVSVGSTDTVLFDYFNNGGSDLEVTAVTFEGPFSLSSDLTLPIVTASGGIGSFEIVFTPVADSSYSGSVTVINNSGDITVPLFGVGFNGAYAETFGYLSADSASSWGAGWIFSNDGVQNEGSSTGATGASWIRTSFSGTSDGMIYHTYNSATDNDTVISPAIELPLVEGEHYELETREYMAYGLDATLSGVAISIDGGSSFELVGEADYSQSGQYDNMYDLTGYSGQTVHIAFVYQATFGNVWAVLDMKIRSKPDPIIPIFARSKPIFPATKIGETSSAMVYYANVGAGNLNADITYPASMSGPTSISELAPGVQDSMLITYTPTVPGIEAGTIVVDGSASGAAVSNIPFDANAGELAFDMESSSAGWRNYSLAGAPWTAPSGSIISDRWTYWRGPNGHSATGYYGVYGYEPYWGGVNDFLVSPRYDISDAVEVLSFYAAGGYNSNGDDPDSLNVWVSTEMPMMGFEESPGPQGMMRIDTGFVNTAAFTKVYSSIPPYNYEGVTVDLSSYDSDVWVLIQALSPIGSDGWMLRVDDIASPEIYYSEDPILSAVERYNFGTTSPAGDTVNLVIRNTGIADLIIDSLELANGEAYNLDLVDAAFPVTVVQDSIVLFPVVFAPYEDGPAMDTLMYYSNYVAGNVDANGYGTDHTVLSGLAANAPPGAVNLIGPADETILIIDGDNAEGSTGIFWTNSVDPDGTPVEYVLELIFENTGDTLDTAMSVTNFFLQHAEVLEYMEEAGVTQLNISWDVFAEDGFDYSTSSNGPWSLTIDGGLALSVDNNTLPEVFALHNNYPNPFNPITNIRYDIPEASDVRIDIYDLVGKKVKTLVSKQHQPGRYKIQWNATNEFGSAVATGMYIYKIQAKDFVSVKKLLLMK